MEHNNLTLEMDNGLINKILDDINMRYILLFLYIIRNDLLNDLKNQDLIESYERVLILDDIFKSNIVRFWKLDFIEIAIDLGLIKNIRSLYEFEQKDADFIVKLGEETVTIEGNTIMVPEETLFLMIKKKFNFLTKRNFNLALTRLKGVSCEKIGIIHPFIYKIGENDYALSNDLYFILDQFGNIYQAIKIEVTIEGFYQRFKKTQDKITEFIQIFDPVLNSKSIIKKINKAIEENKDIIKYLKDEKIKLSDKFELHKIDKSSEIYKEWNVILLQLLNSRFQIEKIEKNILKIKKYYSGKDKIFSYLEFIEKVSFNEDNIEDKIREVLLDLREEIIEIKNKILKLNKKELKLLNIDFERLIITSSED